MLEAFNHPPAFKAVDRRSSEMRRRSGDASQILGSMDDIQPEDPYFILRRAVGLRPTNQSRSKLSSSLDEVALHQIHRESAASDTSHLSSNSSFVNRYNGQSAKSRQEIITAQREVSRANQRAIISAQSNSEQGIDILLPEKGTLRSARHADASVRYSFIHLDGERSDISDILEKEWQNDLDHGQEGKPFSGSAQDSRDLLAGALEKPRSVLQQDIDRVLVKIQGEATSKRGEGRLSPNAHARGQTASPSPRGPAFRAQTPDPPSRSLNSTPTSRTVASPSTRSASPAVRSASPAAQPRTAVTTNHHQQPSIASVMSDLSAYTVSDKRTSPPPQVHNMGNIEEDGQKPHVPRFGTDEMGISRMLALIDLAASSSRPERPAKPSDLDRYYLGTNLSLSELHPQARDLYEPVIQHLSDVDKVCL